MNPSSVSLLQRSVALSQPRPGVWRQRILALVSLSVLLTSLPTVTAQAASFFWTGNTGGSTDGILTNVNNYVVTSGPAVPGALDTVVFVATNGPTNPTVSINWVTNDQPGFVLGSLTFNTNAGVHRTILTGESIRLDGVGGFAVQYGAGGVDHTIATPVVLGATNLTWNVAGAARTLNLSNALSEFNPGSRFIKTGNGTVSFAGSNSFSGGLTVSAGTVITRGQNGLGTLPTAFTTNFIVLHNGGALSFRTNEPPAAPGSPSGNINLNTNAGITLGLTAGNANQRNSAGEIEITAGTLTISNRISAAGLTNRLLKTGNGTLNLRSLTNDFGGGVRVADGVLSLTAEGQLGVAPAALVSEHIALGSVTGAGVNQPTTLQFAGSFELGPTRGIALGFTNNGATFSNRIQVTAGNIGQIRGPISEHRTADGVFSSTNHLAKIGAGTLVLSGTNTYDGNTYVQGGVLTVNGTTGTGDTVLEGTGTLSGSGIVSGSLIATATNTIAPGNSVGTITVLSNVSFLATTTLSIEFSGATSADQLLVGGTLNLGGAALQLTAIDGYVPLGNETWTIAIATNGITGSFAPGSVISLGGFDYGIVYGPNDVQLTAVPEPTPVLLAGIGAGLLTIHVLRRNQRR